MRPVKGKYDFDVVGHYSRPDIFKLEIDKKSKPKTSGF